jgi:hypothetical protein
MCTTRRGGKVLCAVRQVPFLAVTQLDAFYIAGPLSRREIAYERPWHTLTFRAVARKHNCAGGKLAVSQSALSL